MGKDHRATFVSGPILFLENGQHIRYALFTDYQAKWVTAPPDELRAFFEEELP